MTIFTTDPFDKKESEKNTEKFLTSQVQKLGGLSFKWLSTNNAGVPDRICLFKTALVVFVEVKSEGLKPSKLQALVHKAIKALGFEVHVVDTKAKVLQLIEHVKTLIKERQNVHSKHP